MYCNWVMLCNVNAQCDVNIAMHGNGNKNVITEKKNSSFDVSLESDLCGSTPGRKVVIKEVLLWL